MWSTALFLVKSDRFGALILCSRDTVLVLLELEPPFASALVELAVAVVTVVTVEVTVVLTAAAIAAMIFCSAIYYWLQHAAFSLSSDHAIFTKRTNLHNNFFHY